MKQKGEEHKGQAEEMPAKNRAGVWNNTLGPSWESAHN